MIDIEIPLKDKGRLYRFFEMVPAFLSYGSIILLVVLSFVSPLVAAIYLLLIIITTLVKAASIAFHTINGRRYLDKAMKVDWHGRLMALEHPAESYETVRELQSREFGFEAHKENLRLITADPESFPKPSQLYNALIIAAYNESYEVLQPTIEAVLHTTYDKNNLIIVLAYEERGGPGIRDTAKRLKREYGDKFQAFHLVMHPKNLPNELVGKGGNITYAGKFLQGWLDERGIDYKNVIVTTLDSDNRPHRHYFDYVAYEYIVHEDRKHLSYQPVSLFLNNIWDVPAPMRVIATGNSFWNIICSVRPHLLRNFASHAQPMEALVEMNFWSTRTIVEDGHQYWRSYFYFGGRYSVVPLYVPIYQDAVLSDTYGKTLVAQFKQLRRWAYGASDVPYVATRIFTKNRNVPLLPALARLVRLLDSHVTLASVSILTAFGGWVPLIVNRDAGRNIAAHQLPVVISNIQTVAMFGMFITIFLSFKMLPPRPARYKRRRTVWMVLQWLLMPVIAIVYNSLASFNSQTRLLLGKYLDKFEVTEKATVPKEVNAAASQEQ